METKPPKMIKNLSGLRERLVWRLFKQKRELDQALQAYLAEYVEKALGEIHIQEARIPGLNAAGKERLVRLGITSAADVSASSLMAAEGLGVAALRELLAWRYAEEQIIRATMPRQLPAQVEQRLKHRFGGHIRARFSAWQAHKLIGGKMNEVKFKVIEDSDGLGMVFKDGQPIADVFYSLRIHQKYYLQDRHEIPASKTITAQITVIDGERNLFHNSHLTLQLCDGRRWHFSARRGDLVAATYEAGNHNQELQAPYLARGTPYLP